MFKLSTRHVLNNSLQFVMIDFASCVGMQMPFPTVAILKSTEPPGLPASLSPLPVNPTVPCHTLEQKPQHFYLIRCPFEREQPILFLTFR